jgi:hypothetical protein
VAYDANDYPRKDFDPCFMYDEPLYSCIILQCNFTNWSKNIIIIIIIKLIIVFWKIIMFILLLKDMELLHKDQNCLRTYGYRIKSIKLSHDPLIVYDL